MNPPDLNNKLPLSGIRVIAFGAVAIEPITTSFLADFGAEVIRVESNTKVEEWAHSASSAFVGSNRDYNNNINAARYNQNKKSIVLDLKHPEGLALAKKLVATADVVTENFTVGVFKKLGLGYEEFQKVKPDIIMVSASFAGQTGPYQSFRGFGNAIAALSGIADLFGWPDRPAIIGGAYNDHYVPYMLVTLIMTALDYRRRTGKGQFIDSSSFETGVDILDTAILDYGVNGRVMKRMGNSHPSASPHGVYPCLGKDRWCAIAIFNDGEWSSFCRVLGNPEWTSDERFSTLTGRKEQSDEVDKLVGEWTQTMKAEEVMYRLQQANIAAAIVSNAQDIYKDPQLNYREHFWGDEDPELNGFTFESPPARLSKTPARLQRRHPKRGEHNDYVYKELLGLNDSEYARLIKDKVIY